MGLKKSTIKKHGDYMGKGYQGDQIYSIDGIAPTLSAQGGNNSKGSLLVSGQTTSTSMPAKSTEKTLEQENSMKETSEQLTLPQFQTTTLSLEDFLANLSVLLASGSDLKILEAHCSLKSAESLGLNELNIYSLRTSKDCSTIIKGKHLKPLSERWMNWGMTVNGKCLTAMTLGKAKDHASLSLRYFGTAKIMSGKGKKKPFRYCLAAMRGLEMRTLENRKICEMPSELYEHLQGFPIGWTAGIPSTQRKKCCGNAVTTNAITEIGKRLSQGVLW